MHDITPAEPYDLSNSVFLGQHPFQMDLVVTDKLPAVDLHRNDAIVRIAVMRAAIMRIAIVRAAIVRFAIVRVTIVRAVDQRVAKPARRRRPVPAARGAGEAGLPA